MASKLPRRTLGLAGVLVVLVGLGVLYLLNADLGWSRDFVTRTASKTLGRQLRVAGPFHLRLGRVTRLVADQVSLANAPWAEEHDLVAIARCDVALETRSLFSGPVHLLHLELDGVELHLERNADGEASWTARRPATKPRSGGHPSLPHIDRLELRDLHVTYRSPTRTKPFEGELSVARADSDEKGVVGLDLEGVLDGQPLNLKGHVGPLKEIVSGKAFRQDLTFRLGTIEGRLRGTTASLSTLAGSSLDLSLRGPDLADPLGMLGVTGIPGGAFAIEAATRPAGAALDTRLQVTAPLLEIEATGRVLPGKPPRLHLRVAASGRDLAAVGALAGLHELPPKPFTLETTLRAHGFPIRFEKLTIHAAGTTVTADGALGRPPKLEGTDVTLKIDAPDARLIGRLAGVRLPRGKLGASARVTLGNDTVRIEDLDARIGANQLQADGTLGKGARHSRASFEIDLSGPDLAAFDDLAGTPLPAGPFRATGKISSSTTSIELEKLDLELGSNRIEASGRIAATPDRSGSELELELGGRDPTFLASLAGIRGLPPKPYQGSARLHVGKRSLEIHVANINLGDNEASGEITLVRPPSAGPIELELQVHGERLDDLGPLLGLRGLPAHPYRASGTLEITSHDYGFSGVSVQCNGLSATAEGRLGRPPSFEGTTLRIDASGPRLSDLGPVLHLPEMPALPFDLTGGLAIGPEAIELRKLHGVLGRSALAVDGAFRPRGFPLHLGLDVDVHGPDPGDLVSFLVGLGIGKVPSLPPHPYGVRGRIELDPTGYRLTGVHATFGDLEGTIDGFLGVPPGFHDTTLDVEISGGNGANIEELVGWHPMVEGLRFHCSVRRLERASGTSGAVLGIRGTLSADQLALGKKKPAAAGGTKEEPAKNPSGEELEEKQRVLVFPEKPFHLRLPTVLHGKVECRFGELLLGGIPLKHAHAKIAIDPHRLRLDSVQATLNDRGTLSGFLALATPGEDLTVTTDLQLDDADAALLLGGKQLEDGPLLNARIELDGRGASPHQLASHASGRFSLAVTSGKIQSSILDSLGDSIVLSILDALNPFRKKEKMTEMECGAVAGTIEHGNVTLTPVGLKTDKVTTVAHGTIDLATEKISLDFASKARRGLGFSASTLTNQYIKIGGTLRKPSVQLKPVSAMAKTGLAVVTAGISLLAEGLWNRVSSEADICAAMNEEIEKMWQQPSVDPEPPPQRQP